MEEHGPMSVNERILGEYWMRHICAPWNEYGVGQNNIVNGLPPPLSGCTGNDVWKNSNGAWIRSEIWACVFAGSPNWAAAYAWYDACVDHADDGIAAELFTASLEAAAFVESDLRKLIDCALARIPEDSRVARAVKVAIDAFDAGRPWEEAREAVVKDSADLGWFQAPANVAFTVIGLLYGGGDFGKTVCTAVNCGDDTDCTGATAGAVLGIIQGFKAIPEKWIAPIGHAIKSIAVNAWNLRAPRTIEELTERAAAMKECACAEFPLLPRLTDGPTSLPADLGKRLADGKWCRDLVAYRGPNRLSFDLPWCRFSIAYVDGAIVEPGKPVRLGLRVESGHEEAASLLLFWHLPEGWTVSPGPSQSIMVCLGPNTDLEIMVTPGPMAKAVEHVLLEARLSNRQAPVFLTVPFRRKDAAVATTWRDWSTVANMINMRGGSFR
ncbi:MAG: ADP-ribosylglycohydrolase family protein, partial [Kiritimatiellae bacterium]|nr:ADP-ribosylglycohydrolase family protein [Kiritimatiellia bacterium]